MTDSTRRYAKRSWPLALLLTCGGPIDAAETLEFERDVAPLLNASCVSCHGAADPDADLDFTAYPTADAFRAHPDLLENMLWSLEEREMPPERAERQLTEAERARLVHWLELTLDELRNANPNDPGLVIAPRLNHHQYGHVVHDLTGLHLNIERLLPVDGGSGEGFANVGAAHNATAPQVEKYLAAAKEVASHARWIPGEGLRWTEESLPAVSDPQDEIDRLRDAYAAGLVSFNQQHAHKRQYINYSRRPELSMIGAYLIAARQVEAGRSLAQAIVAVPGEPDDGQRLLHESVRRLHRLLTSEEAARHRLLSVVVAAWREIPVDADPDTLRDAGNRAHDLLRDLSALRNHRLSPPDQPGWSDGGKGFERGAWWEDLVERGRYRLWVDHRRLDVANGRLALALRPTDDGNEDDVVRIHAFHLLDQRDLAATEQADSWDPAVRVLSGSAEREGEAWIVRAPAVLELQLPPAAPKWIHLIIDADAARGPHASVQAVLGDPDRLSDLPELVPGQVVIGPPGSERRASLMAAAQPLWDPFYDDRVYSLGDDPFAGLEQLVEICPPKRQRDWSPQLWAPFALGPAELRAEMTAAEREALATIEADIIAYHRSPAVVDELPHAQQAVADFTALAWRRPLPVEIRQRLDAMLAAAVDETGSLDGALRHTLTAVLVHPAFLYRRQATRGSAEPYPLQPYELADRLAFALWGSVPDEALLADAADGSLSDPVVLAAHARRMLADERAARLAEDFAGYWLHYEGFDEHTAVDTERYAAFDDGLRDAMYAEVVTFLDHIIRGGAPVIDVLDSDYSFLNEDLAELYDIPGVEGPELRLVELPADSPRGGVLTMGAILTTTSKPLRTSPVVRGDWILQELIGVELPPIPDDIPLLSDDEVDEQGRTFLEQLQDHRDNPACASCHARLDPLGVALENFDPIGRWREESHTGIPVTTTDALPDGTVLDGIAGLRRYLAQEQQRERFLEHFCRKLVGYTLGRKVLVTDRPLIDEMLAALRANEHRFEAALVTVITSRQFTMRRDDPDLLSQAAP